jgi:glutamate racemase
LIGVFDSGVGGLTVLKALRRAMPHQDFFYLGDTARVPYGRKPPAMVRGFAREITAFLVERGAKAIVVACNTATAVALNDLKKEYPLPIWGVIEPGVEAAVRATHSGKVGVIGTRGAIASGAYQSRLEARGMTVWARACPLFVHLVEEDLADSPEAEVVARHYLGDHPEIDTIILGCTHYPVLSPVIARVLGPGVKLVESATVAAEYVRSAYVRDGEDVQPSGSGKITHFVTGDPIAYEHTAAVIGGVEGEIIALPVSELSLSARLLPSL